VGFDDRPGLLRLKPRRTKMTALTKRDWQLPLPDWTMRGIPERMSWLGLPELDLLAERDGMRLEEFREDGSLVVRAEMPGIDPDKDVEITVKDGILSLRAERREQHEETDEKGFYRSEFRYGQFNRRIPLPPGASDKDVTAKYSDGILEIRLPIIDTPSKGAKVPVTRG
jgi:HSP20 family protein